jgi:hypothetical protein
MFWPLIGAFIAFVLVAVLLGWMMESSGQDKGAGPTEHH